MIFTNERGYKSSWQHEARAIVKEKSMASISDELVMDNFDEENVAEVLASIEQERASGSNNRQLFTMMLRNEYHEAEITEESRDIVTQTIFR